MSDFYKEFDKSILNPFTWNEVFIKKHPEEITSRNGKLAWKFVFQPTQAEGELTLSLWKDDSGKLYSMGSETLMKLADVLGGSVIATSIKEGVEKKKKFFVLYEMDKNGYKQLKDIKRTLTQDDKLQSAIENDSSADSDDDDLPFN